MAEIRRFPIVRHLRADATSHVLLYRNARIVRGGAGLSIWFNPMSDSVAEVPTDDRELALMIHARTADFQDVTVQGILTYRASDPERLAQRVNFTIDLGSGAWSAQPLEKVGLMLSQLAQEYAINHIAATPIRTLLTGGVAPVRDAIESGLNATATLPDIGIALVTVRIGSVKPSSDLEKAIEAPMRESIKQDADEAAYHRRAVAVENERAIAENEMHNRIELAKREEQLIEQQGANAKRQAEDAAAADKVKSESEAERLQIVLGTEGELERRRLEYLRQIAPQTLMALAAREFATKISKIDHLNVTPDLLATLASAFGEKASV